MFQQHLGVLPTMRNIMMHDGKGGGGQFGNLSRKPPLVMARRLGDVTQG